MNSWKNAALAALTALTMAFGGFAWNSYGGRLEALELADEKQGAAVSASAQRISGLEAKVDLLIQLVADVKRQNERILRRRED